LQCLGFPLVFAVPQPAAWVLLAGGLLFHLGIACVMGLNDFLPAFAAAYPIVWEFAAGSLSIHGPLQAYWFGR
jgi:hypothetical protein